MSVLKIKLSMTLSTKKMNRFSFKKTQRSRKRCRTHTSSFGYKCRFSNVYQIGQTGGVESVVLARTHMPPHTHLLQASTDPGTRDYANGSVWAVQNTIQMYTNDDNLKDMFG